MKGVVLSGGTGSRLRPITYTMPKQMIPVGGKPVLQYAIENLRDAGITEIAIVLGEQSHDEIKSHFGDGSDFGVEITYIYQGEPLGLGHAVGCTKDFVGDDNFVVYLGDDLVEGGITEFVQSFDQETYDGAIALKRVDNPSRYGVVKTDNRGDVIGIIEKPSEPPTDLAGIGIFLLTPEIFDHIEEIEPSWRGELELSDAIQRLLSGDSRFMSHIIEGWWRDVGTPEDVLEANRLVLQDLSTEPDVEERGTVENGATVEGPVSLSKDALVEAGATIRGPAIIGEGTIIQGGTYVGPYTTISGDCELTGGSIESSVILSGVSIGAPAELVDSIIGRNASIGEASKPVRGTSALVGTDGNLQLSK